MPVSEANDLKQELTVTYQAESGEVKLTPSIVQNYLVGSDAKITMQEFKFFVELCKAQRLNPFLKEAYCIKFGNKPAQLVVAKDVFVKRAARHPQYDGKETGVIVRTAEGAIEHRNGCFVGPDEKLVGGWARVFRKDRTRPEYMSVSFDEVAQSKGSGELNSNWSGKGATMVEKVAKVRALREAFPDEFQGMYSAEEMGAADMITGEAETRRVIIDASGNEAFEQGHEGFDDLS